MFLKSKYIFLFFFLWANQLIAQSNNELKTSLSSSKILIGEQVILNIAIPINKNIKIGILINKPDTLNEHVELVGSPLIDTLKNVNADTVNIKYLVSSFDSGYWTIPPIPFLINGDTLQSAVQLLTVNTVPVDTSKDIFDIKPLKDAPFTLKEIIPIMISVIAILAVLISLYYWYKSKYGKKPINDLRTEKVHTPYEIAIQQLENIKVQKIWTRNLVKEYYASISDTLREYLFNQFKVNAQEQTTNQTKRSIRHVKLIDDTNSKKIIAVLELSDLVKFAKENPIADEHEMSLRYAFEFIEEVNNNYEASIIKQNQLNEKKA